MAVPRIERLVLVKLNDRSLREDLAARARQLVPGLPGVRDVRVGLPADADAEVWDLLIAASFDALEDVDLASFEALIAPHVQVRKAWSFAITG